MLSMRDAECGPAVTSNHGFIECVFARTAPPPVARMMRTLTLKGCRRDFRSAAISSVLAELGHSQIQNGPLRNNATKPNDAWRRCAGTGHCSPPVPLFDFALARAWTHK